MKLNTKRTKAQINHITWGNEEDHMRVCWGRLVRSGTEREKCDTCPLRFRCYTHPHREFTVQWGFNTK